MMIITGLKPDPFLADYNQVCFHSDRNPTVSHRPISIVFHQQVTSISLNDVCDQINSNKTLSLPNFFCQLYFILMSVV